MLAPPNVGTCPHAATIAPHITPLFFKPEPNPNRTRQSLRTEPGKARTRQSLRTEPGKACAAKQSPCNMRSKACAAKRKAKKTPIAQGSNY